LESNHQIIFEYGISYDSLKEDCSNWLPNTSKKIFRHNQQTLRILLGKWVKKNIKLRYLEDWDQVAADSLPKVKDRPHLLLDSTEHNKSHQFMSLNRTNCFS